MPWVKRAGRSEKLDYADIRFNLKITLLVSTVEVCERIVALNKGEVVKDIVTSEETLKELEAFFAV